MAHFARSRRVWIVLAFLVTLATASDRLTAQSPPPLSSPFARLVLKALIDARKAGQPNPAQADAAPVAQATDLMAMLKASLAATKQAHA